MLDLKKVTVVIPSSGRPDRQVTLAQLPTRIQSRVMVAVPEVERESYAKYKVWAVPEIIKGISHTRKYLMENCTTRYLLMIDDDMTFAYRPDMASAKLVSVQPGDNSLNDMFSFWYSLMERYAHVGLSARQGNNRVMEEVKVCCRMFNTYMYDLDVVMSCGVELGRVPVMEDFDLTLQLLRDGYENAVIYKWCWNQPGSNAAGGCSQYRTCEMQKQAAVKLAQLHPGLVRTIEKESKNWNGMNQRIDVVISWAKAIEEGRRCQR